MEPKFITLYYDGETKKNYRYITRRPDEAVSSMIRRVVKASVVIRKESIGPDVPKKITMTLAECE